jgi:hypothetical protein
MKWSRRRGKSEAVCQETNRQMSMEQVGRRAGKVGERERGEVCSVNTRCKDWPRK